MQIFFNSLRIHRAHLVDCATAFRFAAEENQSVPFNDELANRLTVSPNAAPHALDQSPTHGLLYQLEEQLRKSHFQVAVPDKGD